MGTKAWFVVAAASLTAMVYVMKQGPEREGEVSSKAVQSTRQYTGDPRSILDANRGRLEGMFPENGCALYNPQNSPALKMDRCACFLAFFTVMEASSNYTDPVLRDLDTSLQMCGPFTKDEGRILMWNLMMYTATRDERLFNMMNQATGWSPKE